MLKSYESLIVVSPLLSEEQMKEVKAKFSKLLKDNGAEIVHEDYWGLRKLAYPMGKKTTGFYNVTEFKAPGDIIAKLEIEYKRDERIMRFMTIVLDKYAKEYNEKKRKGLIGSAPAPKSKKTGKEIKVEGAN